MQMGWREGPFPKMASSLACLDVGASCWPEPCLGLSSGLPVWSFRGSWLPHSTEAFGWLAVGLLTGGCRALRVKIILMSLAEAAGPMIQPL